MNFTADQIALVLFLCALCFIFGYALGSGAKGS